MQDIFVLMLTGGKREGTYIEIGAFHSTDLSNTCVLERDYGWKGISVEIDYDRAKEFAENRTNTIIIGDATKQDYPKLLAQTVGMHAEIDYLSVDCEPAATSFEALKKVLDAGIKPKIVTFEHELYHEGSGIRNMAREYMEAMGYELLVEDVGFEKQAFEDWYVRPECFDRALLDLLSFDSDAGTAQLAPNVVGVA